MEWMPCMYERVPRNFSRASPRSGTPANSCHFSVCATALRQQHCCVSSTGQVPLTMAAIAAEHCVSKGSNRLGNENKATAPTWQVLGNWLHTKEVGYKQNNLTVKWDWYGLEQNQLHNKSQTFNTKIVTAAEQIGLHYRGFGRMIPYV